MQTASDPFAAIWSQRRQAKAERVDSAGELTLEKLLCDPRLGKFTASPVQLGLVRAVDGVAFELPPKFADDGSVSVSPAERMHFHFGLDRLPTLAPRIIIPRTGVRAGKSLISALGLLKSVLTCKFRRPPEPHETPDADGMVGVRAGEFVRAVIVGPTIAHSRAAMGHIVGTMKASAALKKLLVSTLKNSCTVLRPDGNEVTIEAVAASAGGAGLRSTWLAGALFDEADFHDAEDAAVNLPEQVRAARPRLLAGAQMWIPSSPWTDAGPFHEMFTAAFGKPMVNETLAFHSDSRSMNPTLSRSDEAAERQRDPENAAREYDAIPIPAGTSRFFPDDAIAKSVAVGRTAHLASLPGTLHYSGSDLGFRKNSSALALSRYENRKVRLAYHEELRPTREASLKPSEVVRGFAKKCIEYGARTLRGDLHYADTAIEELQKFRDEFTGDKPRVPSFEEFEPSRDAQAALFAEFKRRMQEGLVELPDSPRLLSQMKATTSRPMPGGAIQIVLPKQGHAHGDLLMAVVLSVCATPCEEPRAAAKPQVFGQRRMASGGGI